jgi:soluble lytic murein transglycosylase-like protein
MTPAEFIEQIPYGETREYVKNVLASSAIYSRLYRLPSDPGSIPLPPRP